jgi:hypothetical protein
MPVGQERRDHQPVLSDRVLAVVGHLQRVVDVDLPRPVQIPEMGIQRRNSHCGGLPPRIEEMR